VYIGILFYCSDFHATRF